MSDVQPKLPNIPAASPGAGTAPSFKRGRGRPPKAQKKRLVRAKAKTRKKESTTNIETEASAETATQAETENPKSAEASEAPRYQLRSKRQPRYKCGTCGLRDCLLVSCEREPEGSHWSPGSSSGRERKTSAPPHSAGRENLLRRGTI